jgi:hypothetical protein
MSQAVYEPDRGDDRGSNGGLYLGKVSGLMRDAEREDGVPEISVGTAVVGERFLIIS